MSARESGTSLTELLAALAIGSIVSLAAVQLHSNAINAAATVDGLETLADKARLLQRLLHKEITRAGMAPCGGATPVRDWTGGGQTNAAASLSASGGLHMSANTLRISHFVPDPEYADLSYQQLISGALGTAVQLDEIPAQVPAINEPLLAGNCDLLHKVTSSGGSGSLLFISGNGLDPDQLPETGWIWRENAINGSISTAAGARLHSTSISHTTSSSDGRPAITIDGDPILSGISEFQLSFSSCNQPNHFSPATAISDWPSVCAVRAFATISTHQPSASELTEWPLTVTVPIRSRL